jgi:putative selenate reductase
MAELRPYPLGPLVTRMFRELESHDSIFDLPRAHMFGEGGGPSGGARQGAASAAGEEGRGAAVPAATPDLSVRFHDRVASTPLGPAAGPQSQMAQNLVLSWLGGCRVMELKTVQIMDELDIPRPCIDMATVGYNVEWSQELKLEQSLEEYVKGAMLVEMLRASGRLPGAATAPHVIYDMSVGYDLEGIRSERVSAFLAGMSDCSAVIDRLRPQIPAAFGDLRDLDFPTGLSRTLTLSTFHGCPPEEIERIIEFLLREHGLHCIVKLNPTLLGPQSARALLHDTLGYDDVAIPDEAFVKDASWDQALGFTERLARTAAELGQGFGVKFSNTLIVRNQREFFPASEQEMYLSGTPLHVLAMELVRRFRRVFGQRIPVSFAAGVDRHNFADAVSLGLVPVTVCSDLLKPGGYARAHTYLDALTEAMAAVGAHDVPDWILRSHGQAHAALDRLGLEADDPRLAACRAALAGGGDGDGEGGGEGGGDGDGDGGGGGDGEGEGDLAAAAGPELHERWVAEASLLNTELVVEALHADPRYDRDHNSTPPRKIGSPLVLFDCITCDKCVPVCPNDANFKLVMPALDLPVVKLVRRDGAWIAREDGRLVLGKKHQIANFADFCNECGNCDVFCPEDGGPYLIKPRFFGTRADFDARPDRDGFFMDRQGEEAVLHGRFEGSAYRLSRAGARLRFAGPGFELTLDPDDVPASLEGEAAGEVDLTWMRILMLIRDAAYGQGALHYAALLA